MAWFMEHSPLAAGKEIPQGPSLWEESKGGVQDNLPFDTSPSHCR